MQELADPITKLTWDNAALMSPATAKKLGIKFLEEEIRDGQGTGLNGDWIEISVGDRKVKAAVLVDPGHVDNSVSLSLGYGRVTEGVGRVGRFTGFNAYPLRSSGALYFVSGAKVAKVAGDVYVFSTTQQHYNMEGRALVRELPLETYREHPGFGEDGRSFVQKFGMDAHIAPTATIYRHPKLDAEQQWGMAIDLNTCTGCSACVVACQSENNIPVVGKEQVRRGRIMQWIRMDRYYSSASPQDEDPQVMMQPVTCHHCENAPCETVCPVNATVHNEEGLNVMAYNRCIGTRYCANNCPYTARRFNWFDYNKRNPLIDTTVLGMKVGNLYAGPLGDEARDDESLRLQRNPNVTVRMRGVIEKCTYCVQRLEDPPRSCQLRRSQRDSKNFQACRPTPDQNRLPAGLARRKPSSSATWQGSEQLFGCQAQKLRHLRLPRCSNTSASRHAHELPGPSAQSESQEHARRRKHRPCMSTLKDSHGNSKPAHH